MPRKSKPDAPIKGVYEKKVRDEATGEMVGTGTWWIRYSDSDGNYKREKVGRRSDAISLYQTRKSDALHGKKMPKNLRLKGIKFGDLADAILEFSKTHHKDTRNVGQRLRRLKEVFGSRVAAEIKPAEIDAWLTSINRSAATANRYRATISLIYREGIVNGKVTQNPARLVKARREDNARKRFLSPVEEKRLVDAINDLFPHHLPELVISLRTGMRLSEQYQLTWGEIDLLRNEINLSDTKNGTPRTIPMSAGVVDAFKQRWDSTSDHTSEGRVFDIYEPRKWFASAMRMAEITGYRWHDNRHTFCSRLAEKGATVFTLMKLAGHKTMSMSARYTHMSDATLTNAVQMLD